MGQGISKKVKGKSEGRRALALGGKDRLELSIVAPAPRDERYNESVSNRTLWRIEQTSGISCINRKKLVFIGLYRLYNYCLVEEGENL